MVRSRNGCPGQTHSSTPLSSRSTAWKIRSPRRVGSTPLATTRPTQATSWPTLGLGQRSDGGRIYIAVGKVPQKIARRADAETLQSFGPPLPDALEKLDRSIEANGGRERRGKAFAVRTASTGVSASRFSAKRSGSNGSRSSTDSPRPMNRIGTPSSRRSAATAPPRALPSSLVTMMPVGETAWAKSLPCWMAFWPDGPVEHQEGFVRRARQTAADDPGDLPQLLHQPFLGVEPAGGIDDHGVDAAGDSRRRLRRRPPRRDRLRARPPRRVGQAGWPRPGAARWRRRGRCRRPPAGPCDPPAAAGDASFAAVVVFPVPLTPTSRTTVGPGSARAMAPGSSGPGEHVCEPLHQGPLEIRLRLELARGGPRPPAPR